MLLVDGMNVIGARPDGWWEDRTEAMRLMAWELRAFAEDTGEEVTVVFDGRPIPAVLRGHGIEVQFAPGGANAADRRIERLVGDHDDPGEVTVVTSDKALSNAVTAAGASVIGSGEFRTRLDELDGSRPG
ncbi:MAG TPA: NYN domain-containing protein [Solirubrobacterales bacterium]